MKTTFICRIRTTSALILGSALLALGQAPDTPPPPEGDRPSAGEAPPPGGPDDFGGPPPLGPGGFGPGGPGGPGGFGGAMPETALVKQFDQNADGWLNRDERQAAREFVAQQQQEGGRRFGGPGGRRGGFGPGGMRDPQATPQPGAKLTPADVKSFPDAPLYAPDVIRTLFLEFENADWEKELADFKNTDVEVPAKLTVDGKTYSEVGVSFRGMSSFMMVGEGQKRSLMLTMDLVHEKQQLAGHRKIKLLNSHGDPSFLHTVLSLEAARDYLPAPQANFMRVVINGESWGLFVNQQHFTKEFVKESFGSTKGARWKVPGSPNGRAGLEYLGDEAAPYQRLFEIKSKDDPESWAALANLCKVLNQTPSDQLETTLAPLLDIEGVLKFLAWENVFANGDGYYTRASDYSLYREPGGRFHVIPYDANETFNSGGGPGGPGGPGGRGGRGGGMGPGGFGPGMFLAPQLIEQADQNADGKLARDEFSALAEEWQNRLDPDHTGKLTQEQFVAKLSELLPMPQGPGGFGPPGAERRPGGQPGPGGFGPAMFMGPGLFAAFDGDQDGTVSRVELKDTFARWFTEWDTAKSGALDEETLRLGLNTALPQPSFGGPGGPGGGRRGGGRGGPGFGGGGVNLDPLVAANDSGKPLLSKLLAVPALRARYLGDVRDLAERWLDWNRLGPVATQYHTLIADDVKADTRKLDSTEAFLSSLTGGLKAFADQRRAFLLNLPAVKEATISTPATIQR